MLKLVDFWCFRKAQSVCFVEVKKLIDQYIRKKSFNAKKLNNDIIIKKFQATPFIAGS